MGSSSISISLEGPAGDVGLLTCEDGGRLAEAGEVGDGRTIGSAGGPISMLRCERAGDGETETVGVGLEGKGVEESEPPGGSKAIYIATASDTSSYVRAQYS